MQDWLQMKEGQLFLNYAYNIGAAVVILGTLFKLTHLPGANFLLFVGMGTEVIVFLISAFDTSLVKGSTKRKTEYEEEDGISDTLFELSAKLEKMEDMGTELDDSNLEHYTIKQSVAAIREAYQLQLEKTRSSLKEMEAITEQQIMTRQYIEELNGIYVRMIDALNKR